MKELYGDFSAGCGKFRLHLVMRGFELTSERSERIRRALAHPVPKLVIWGLSDPSLGAQFEHRSLIKNATIKSYPEAKHFLMLDYAGKISRDIVQWLRAKSLDEWF